MRGKVREEKVFSEAREGMENKEIGERLNLPQEKQLVSGVSVFSMSESGDLWIGPELAAHSFFPLKRRAQIKALACQLPAR